MLLFFLIITFLCVLSLEYVFHFNSRQSPKKGKIFTKDFCLLPQFFEKGKLDHMMGGKTQKQRRNPKETANCLSVLFFW